MPPGEGKEKSNTMQTEEKKDYRYFLVLKETREFKVMALESHKDPNAMKIKYNAPILVELTIHEYFEYIYKFYGGNLQYFKY